MERRRAAIFASRHRPRLVEDHLVLADARATPHFASRLDHGLHDEHLISIGESRGRRKRFALSDGTTFGIISSTTEPFCRNCDRSRLTADGMWYLCLYATDGIDLRAALRRGATADEIEALIGAGWRHRVDRGAEERLALGDRRAFVPIKALRSDPHLEMHTRGG